MLPAHRRALKKGGELTTYGEFVRLISDPSVPDWRILTDDEVSQWIESNWVEDDISACRLPQPIYCEGRHP